MSKINEVIHGIHHMDDVAAKDSTINNLHPLSKIIVTFMYIVVVVSFDKYNLPVKKRITYSNNTNKYQNYLHIFKAIT